MRCFAWNWSSSLTACIRSTSGSDCGGERQEVAGLRLFLDQVDRPGLQGLVELDEPVAGLYGDHWSVTGQAVPGRDSPDESVGLPGRNLFLITKAAVWCGIRGVETLAIGTLASNPFPDGSDAFFDAVEASIQIGLGVKLRLIRPFHRLTKAEVIRRGAGLPLGLTISCLDPTLGHSCGVCNKCEERRLGFESAGLADPSL